MSRRPNRPAKFRAANAERMARNGERRLYICGMPTLPLAFAPLLNHYGLFSHYSSSHLHSIAQCPRTLDICYVCNRLPMASTMYARIATQIPYALMYGIDDKAQSTAITAIMSEAINHPFDGA